MTCCGAQNLRSQRSRFTQQESSQLVFFFACSSCAFVPFSGVCALWTALTGTGTYILNCTGSYWNILHRITIWLTVPEKVRLHETRVSYWWYDMIWYINFPFWTIVYSCEYVPSWPGSSLDEENKETTFLRVDTPTWRLDWDTSWSKHVPEERATHQHDKSDKSTMKHNEAIPECVAVLIGGRNSSATRRSRASIS